MSTPHRLDDLIAAAIDWRLEQVPTASEPIPAAMIDRIMALANGAAAPIQFPGSAMSDRASELMAARNGRDSLSAELLAELDRLMEEDDDEA